MNALLDTIQVTVAKGDKVAITGFGVFEKAVRPARTARNPATGATIKVPKSSVPKFRAGADFKAVVNGDKKVRRQEAVRLPPQQAPPAAWAGGADASSGPIVFPARQPLGHPGRRSAFRAPAPQAAGTWPGRVP